LDFDNWEVGNSDPSTLHEDYNHLDTRMIVSGAITESDNIAQLAVNNPAENELSENEEDNGIHSIKPLFITSEVVVYMHELRRSLKGYSNVEDSIFLIN